MSNTLNIIIDLIIKKRKHDLLANELASIYKAKLNIIPIVMTWDGIVTIYHKKYLKQLGIKPKIQAYMQFITLKKTLESINFDFRRQGLEEDMPTEKVLEAKVEIVQSEVVNTVAYKSQYE